MEACGSSGLRVTAMFYTCGTVRMPHHRSIRELLLSCWCALGSPKETPSKNDNSQKTSHTFLPYPGNLPLKRELQQHGNNGSFGWLASELAPSCFCFLLFFSCFIALLSCLGVAKCASELGVASHDELVERPKPSWPFLAPSSSKRVA